MRKLAVVVTGAVMLATFAGCSSSSSSSKGTASTSSTPTAGKPASAWVERWKPTLVNDYGTAQQRFLVAIESGGVADIRTAAQTVLTANAALTTAITGAGPPPASDRAAAARLGKGLGTEVVLINEVLKTCTAASQECQAGVTAFANNNSKQIVPALTALGATR